MVKPRRGVLLASGAGLVAAAWLLWPRPTAPVRSGAASPIRRGREATTDEIPRIDLARLENLAKRAAVQAGPRDPGEYPKPPAPPPPPPVTEPAFVPPTPPPGPPPPPPLNMTYVGNVQSDAGLRVAVFITDKKIVLSGKEGEVVGSRMRVVKIGLESVDVEDLTSGRSQRLALPKKGAGAKDAREPRDAKGRGEDRVRDDRARERDREGADQDGGDREPGGNSR